MPGVIAPVAAGPQCGSVPGGLNVGNAYRVGVDGPNAPIPAAAPTLPQPTFPGYNAVAAGASEALDPNFRPNVVDSFDLTIQRQITSKVLVELGYIGRKITHEYQPINLNAVPYMMTLGGQQFQKAYANVEVALGCNISYAACGAGGKPAALTPQPFFETLLAGHVATALASRAAQRLSPTKSLATLRHSRCGACGAIWTMAGSISRAA